MAFWTLFLVASMPVVKVLLISGLGAVLASESVNILTEDARKHINKIIFVVFTPALMFSSLAKSVTLRDIISWWYMPFNVLLTFLIGGVLGCVVVKITKPPSHLRGLVLGSCAAGNLGNLLLIIIPAICQEKGSPFGDPDICVTYGMAYVSFSMAVGAIYIWSFVYNIVRISSERHQGTQSESWKKESVPSTEYVDVGILSSLLPRVPAEMPISTATNGSTEKNGCNDVLVSLESKDFSEDLGKDKTIQCRLKKLTKSLHLQEIMVPPTIATVAGFVIGMIPQAKSLLIAPNAPLQVIQDSIALLGDGTIPSITLILGGNLTKGLHNSEMKRSIILGIVLVRFLILPSIGVFVLKGASYFGMVKSDPLYHFILLIQFALPPAMSMGTMTQLFGTGESDCSVIFLWTYLLASVALTVWATIYMWILT